MWPNVSIYMTLIKLTISMCNKNARYTLIVLVYQFELISFNPNFIFEITCERDSMWERSIHDQIGSRFSSSCMYTSILQEIDWKIKSCEWSVEFFIGYLPSSRVVQRASGWPLIEFRALGGALMISVSRCLARGNRALRFDLWSPKIPTNSRRIPSQRRIVRFMI